MTTQQQDKRPVAVFMQGDRVTIRHDAAKVRRDWRGQDGTVAAWHHDHTYTVTLDSGKTACLQADEMAHDVRPVAECWTCAYPTGYGTSRRRNTNGPYLTCLDLTAKQADTHRAAGHDVRQVTA